MSSKSPRQKTDTAIPGEFKPFYEQQFADSFAASQRVPTTPYAGQWFAPQNYNQTQGFGGAADVSNRLIGQGYGQNVLDLGNATVNGQYLHPDSNPYLRASMDAAVRPNLESFERVALPQLRFGANRAGAYDGVRRGLAEAQLGSDVYQTNAGILAEMALNNYLQERQNQLTLGPELVKTGAAMQYLPQLQLIDIGNQQRQIENEKIQAGLAQWQDQIEAPMRAVNARMGVLGLNVGQNVRSTTTTPTNWGQAIGGALTGAALIKAFKE